MFEIRLKNRMLNPVFFQSETLSEVSYKARLLFQGLWCASDREGRLIDKPVILRSLLFPYDKNIDIHKTLKELADTGVIVRYEIEGKRFIWIPRFREMQPIHPNERASKIPPPPDDIIESYRNKIKQVNSQDKKAKRKEITPTIIEKQVIDDFNNVTGKHIKYTETHIRRIRARIKEGFSLNDFKIVHRVKYADWKDDDKLAIYIRPETLHGTRFDSYLNQKNGRDNNAEANKQRTRRDEILATRQDKINQGTNEGETTEGDYVI